jgi:predicted AAA+ superfamily ATPase
LDLSDLFSMRLKIGALTLYRNILTDETVSLFLRLISQAEDGDAASFCDSYGGFIKSLSERNAALNFSAHMETLIRYDDNTFSRAAAGGETEGSCRALKQAALFDLELLRDLNAVSCSDLKSSVRPRSGNKESALIDRLPSFNSQVGLLQKETAAICDELESFYHENGCGVFARYGAFRWQGGLIGVLHPDPVRLSDLKGYEFERGLVSQSVLDFLEGRGGGNLLLYGDRGTGKSSTIKALANEHRAKGLRIVEITKEYIRELPDILERLRHIPLKFILFLDDLTFSVEDEAFSALKSVLEGGVIARPENCRVYATSNRRHIVKESFSDRDADDVHGGETLQEKLALFDRFDRTVNFFSPDQEKYLSIVRAIADERGLYTDTTALERGAIQWALRSGGRSPRIAKQYVEWAKAQLQTGKQIFEGNLP